MITFSIYIFNNYILYYLYSLTILIVNVFVNLKTIIYIDRITIREI